MPADFNPRVWWVVLGMNDLGRMQCSEEVVVLGILRVVEEIRTRKPDAKIVINSLLPMADLRGGLYPQIRDYRDAFRDQYKGRPGTPNRLDNPALYARGPGGAAGSAAASAAAEAAIKAAIQYQRPVTTTTALRNRHKGTHRGGPLPTGAARPVGGAGAPLRPGGAPGTPNTGGNDNDGKTPGGAGAAKRFPRDDGTRKLKKRKDDEVVEEDDNGEPKTRAEIKKDKKAEKKFIKQIKKDPVNPKLNMDKTKIKARDPKKLYMKPNRLPLWTSIHAINEQLRKFAEKHESITFFDATDIFAERLDGKRYVLQSDKISIRGHPTAKGFQEWEEAMATKLKKMFEKDDEELAKEAAAAEEQEKEQQKQPGKTSGGQEKNSDSDSSDDDDTA
jgi:lysophospholipase L1-like esterase